MLKDDFRFGTNFRILIWFLGLEQVSGLGADFRVLGLFGADFSFLELILLSTVGFETNFRVLESIVGLGADFRFNVNFSVWRSIVVFEADFSV